MTRIARCPWLPVNIWVEAGRWDKFRLPFFSFLLHRINVLDLCIINYFIVFIYYVLFLHFTIFQEHLLDAELSFISDYRDWDRML